MKKTVSQTGNAATREKGNQNNKNWRLTQFLSRFYTVIIENRYRHAAGNGPLIILAATMDQANDRAAFYTERMWKEWHYDIY
jgi:hypothetical protein